MKELVCCPVKTVTSDHVIISGVTILDSNRFLLDDARVHQRDAVKTRLID